MKRIFGVVALLVVTAASAGELVGYTDITSGGKPSSVMGVCVPGFELWTFCQPDFPLWEAGSTGLWQIGPRTALLGGGYASYWQRTGKWYAEPYAIVWHELGNTRLTGKIGIYLPLSGDRCHAFSDEMSATWPISKSLRAGVTSKWWATAGVPMDLGIGPMIEYKTGTITLGSRLTIENHSSPVFRALVSTSF